MRNSLACAMASFAALTGCGSDAERTKMVAANVSAIELARQIQSKLASSGKCPTELLGFSQSNGIGRLERKPSQDLPYWLYFMCDGDLNFDLTVSYSIDSGTALSGREEGPLEISYGHFSKPRTLKVLPSDDTASIALRVVREQ